MSHLTESQKQLRPVRAAIFSTLPAAEEAVSRLVAAGFPKEHITVVCSDDAKERHFRQFEHQEPAGANLQPAAATGGAIGAAIGGLAAGAIGVATGGLPLIVAGGVGLLAGGAWGTFIGAMMTRGVEKEVADFYDQEVARGKLLVAVEEHGSNADPSLADAERIFAESGAEPLPLTEG